MKKKDKEQEQLLKRKREKHNFQRKLKRYNSSSSGLSVYEKERKMRKTWDEKVIKKYSFDLDKFLDKNNSSPAVSNSSSQIQMPFDFRLENNQDEVFAFIKTVRKTIMRLSGGEITIDFTKCTKVDFSSLFLLRCIIMEYINTLEALDRRLSVTMTCPLISVIESNNPSVNLRLLACSFISETEGNKDDQPLLFPMNSLKFQKGSRKQRKYSENKKGKTATEIRKYVDSCLHKHSVGLTPQEQKHFDGIISEMLNNAEDHSSFDSWYSFGNFFTNDNVSEDELVGEVNLAIMNFGYSISDGLLDTKDKNRAQFEDISKVLNILRSKDKRKKFSDENFITLLSLQEGISRLKHEDSSRGTGTMTFIQSFIEAGDYQCEKNSFHPSLIIYSGNTVLKCEPRYRPFERKGRNWVTLNKEKSIVELPDQENLWASKRRFPGTLIVVKMYLNKQHLHHKIQNEEQNS